VTGNWPAERRVHRAERVAMLLRFVGCGQADCRAKVHPRMYAARNRDRCQGALPSTAARAARRCATAAGLFLVVWFLGDPLPTNAQQAAYATSNAEAARQLAQRALECLHRGEDLVSTASRLAAYREGLELAQRAVAADDTNASAHFALFANNGRVLLMEGQTPNPLNLLAVNRELERVLELDPNYADALAARGGLYRQLPRLLGGSLDKAEADLTRAIALDADAVGARIELAQTYRDMGHPERSVPLLTKAAQVAESKGKYRQLAEARSLLRELGVPQ